MGGNMARGISIHIGLNELDQAEYGTPGKLRGCENDARSMQDIANSLGYESTLLLTQQATAVNVLREISRAAERLEANDILLLSYAGHGSQVPDTDGDEAPTSAKLDETWCLYDRMLIDDELYRMWGQFKPDVRVVVVSDSCHSGDVLRFIEENRPLFTSLLFNALPADSARDLEEPIYRVLPTDDAIRAYQRNARRYEEIQASGVRSDRVDIRATVLLLAACQDNQTAGDGREHGIFTAALLTAWNQGKFRGSYKSFFSEIVNLLRLTPTQSPNYQLIGVSNAVFEAMQPFSITKVRDDAPAVSPPAVNPPLSVDERLARLKLLTSRKRNGAQPISSPKQYA
jgi:metacaspase-1